ncbi:hypothetical protein ECC02_007165 [Trypanosoma cruzi]|uniref:Uncharacterized protein n=1 Tax=Trypanosoma cruzi TaxID=5693 RepID=A0A7J6XZI8_TRYCR|nr:hypothetical protein ECC02_007165 [Trypanosoma cruzi]
MPGKQSRMAESGAHGVKGQSIFQSPGGTRAQTVRTAVGIAARETRTVRRTSVSTCCRGRAQAQSQEYRSTADPRERGRGAAMPRGITGLGSRGHQAALHGPPAVWRNHRGGHDCGPPVCGQLQLGAGCLLVRQCARCMLPLQWTRPATFRPSRYMWECHGCHSHGASVHLQPCDHSGQRRCARRGGIIPVSCTQGKGSMFPSWQHACLSRDAVLRPRSVGWQMVIRVHANKWTSSGRHAVRVAQSRRKQDAVAANPRCLSRVV